MEEEKLKENFRGVIRKFLEVQGPAPFYCLAAVGGCEGMVDEINSAKDSLRLRLLKSGEQRLIDSLQTEMDETLGLSREATKNKLRRLSLEELVVSLIPDI